MRLPKSKEDTYGVIGPDLTVTKSSADKISEGYLRELQSQATVHNTNYGPEVSKAIQKPEFRRAPISIKGNAGAEQRTQEALARANWSFPMHWVVLEALAIDEARPCPP